jgi:hypothetical protein
MIEALLTIALIGHFILSCFTVWGAFYIRRALKKPFISGINLNGISGGLGMGMACTLLIFFARWMDWHILQHTVVILATPYVLIGIVLRANHLTVKQIKRDSEEYQGK